MFQILTLNPQAFGFDLSDLSLKICELKRRGNNILVSSFGEWPLPQGLMEQGEVKKEDELAKFIKSSLSQVQGQPLSTKYVITSLPEEKAFLQVIQLPRMRAEEVPSAVQFQAENYIPYPIETVYLDSQIISPIQDHLDHLDVLLAALSKTTVDSYVSTIQKAGLIPKILEIESLAVSRALIEQERTPDPVLIIDLGAVRTGFIVFAGSSVRLTASAPVSSEQFTQAIVKSLQVDSKTADKLKKEYGVEREQKRQGIQVFEALIPPLTDLIEQIQKYLRYYETHALHQHLPQDERNIAKILLCGGGANLKGLPEFLTKELKIETSVGNPWVNILQFPLKQVPPLTWQNPLVIPLP